MQFVRVLVVAHALQRAFLEPAGPERNASQRIDAARGKALAERLSGTFFDASGHLPLDRVRRACGETVEAAERERCVQALSSARWEGFGVLDARRVLHEPPSGPSFTVRMQCRYFAGERRDLCLEVMSAAETPPGETPSGRPAASCPKIRIGQEAIHTSEYGRKLSKLLPFFDRPAQVHYFHADKRYRSGYATRPVEHGCGVVALAKLGRGAKIGLAGVAQATSYEGLLVTLQETPWLGTNLNHCSDANSVVKLVKGEVWLHASRPVLPGEEITLDYDAASAAYPNLFMPAVPGMTCSNASAHQTASALVRRQATRGR